jgi:hypothetical protein
MLSVSPLHWRPSLYASLALDLDADRVTGTDGTAIATWADSSKAGAVNNFTQATAGKRPLIKRNIIGGHSAVLFDGVDDFMTSAFAPASGPCSVYVVFSMTNGSASLLEFKDATGKHTWMQIQQPGGLRWGYFAAQVSGAGSRYMREPRTITGSAAHVMGWRYDGVDRTAPSSFACTIDGEAGSPLTTNATGRSTEPSAIGAYVDPLGVASFFYSGYQARILYFTERLSAQKDAAVVNYLRNRYGI